MGSDYVSRIGIDGRDFYLAFQANEPEKITLPPAVDEAPSDRLDCMDSHGDYEFLVSASGHRKWKW
jgi:hypothetical protein